MARLIGTIARGLRAPIVKDGDDLKQIVVDTVMNCVENGDFTPRDKDILCITESILARTQKNFCTTEQIAKDVANKIIFMDEGKILEEGTPEEIFENPKHERVREFIGGIGTI